jgi:nucleoside-diphosphate-sugar epimerase
VNASDEKEKEIAMKKLSGRRVLITGASGVVAFPVAVELAKDNEVFAVARFSDPEQSRMLERAGARPIAFDLADPDLSPLPESVDVVINYAVLPPTQRNAYEVNAGATGRLARRYRNCEAFVHGSTGSLYQYQGERPLREDDPYGLHSSAENYAASKIAAEFLLKHLSEDYQLPVVIVRIFSFFGPRGGGVTQRVDQIIRGEPVSVYPGVRNVHTPLYEDDYVEKTAAAVGIAKVGGEIINVGGTEPVTTQEYCQMAGEILGKEPVFVDNSKAWPIWADTTKMVELLGPNKVPIREGLRRTIESAAARLNTSHHVIGESAKV